MKPIKLETLLPVKFFSEETSDIYTCEVDQTANGWNFRVLADKSTFGMWTFNLLSICCDELMLDHGQGWSVTNVMTATTEAKKKIGEINV